MKRLQYDWTMLFLPEGLHLSSGCFKTKIKNDIKNSVCVYCKSLIFVIWWHSFCLRTVIHPEFCWLLLLYFLLLFNRKIILFSALCDLKNDLYDFLKRLVTHLLRDIQSDKTNMRHIWQQKQISHSGRSSKFTKRTKILGRRERDCPAR